MRIGVHRFVVEAMRGFRLSALLRYVGARLRRTDEVSSVFLPGFEMLDGCVKDA